MDRISFVLGLEAQPLVIVRPISPLVQFVKNSPKRILLAEGNDLASEYDPLTALAHAH